MDNIKSLIPIEDSKIDLGSSNRRFSNIYATTGVINTSDYNDKKNIKDLDPILIKDFINALKPVQYEFENGLRTHFGLIAQEVEETIYDLGLNSLDFAGFCRSPIVKEVEVNELDLNKSNDEDKKLKMKKIISNEVYGIRYEEFIAPLIKCVQLLFEENNRLKEEIDNLNFIIIRSRAN